VDTELANDRTFLAWLRTGIALFGLGFVVAKVALVVQPDETRLEDKNFYSAVGVVIVLSGPRWSWSAISNMHASCGPWTVRKRLRSLGGRLRSQ
jgi:uncharacterized membrane protein YidH (DUF202 family)